MPFLVTRTIPEAYRTRNAPDRATTDWPDLKSTARHIGQVILINTSLTHIGNDVVDEIRRTVREAMRKRQPQTWTHEPSGYVFRIEFVEKEPIDAS